MFPRVQAECLADFQGRNPDYGEILQRLRFGNSTQSWGWDDGQLVQVAANLAEKGEPGEFRPQRLSHSSLWGRVSLFSAGQTAYLARPLEWLASGWMLVFLGLVGLCGFVLLIQVEGKQLLQPWHWVLGLLLFLWGAVVHELGHAAALARQGYPAGGMGWGMLFVIPVLHNDVSAISQLPTRGKLKVDLAGVAFQSALGSVLVAGATFFSWGESAFFLAAKMTFFAVAWSLTPFIRTDGYWAFCDGLGYSDLDVPQQEKVTGLRLWVLSGHRVLNVLFLILISVVLPLSWKGRLLVWVPEAWQLGASVVLLAGLLFLWVRVAYRIKNMVVSLISDGRKTDFSHRNQLS